VRGRQPELGIKHEGHEEDSGPGVLSLLREIRSGTVVATSLGKENRRACVEYLAAEGFSVAEMSETLKVSDRTIRRDRLAIRSAHAVERTLLC